jgi:SAM-dependent methyltransferase
MPAAAAVHPVAASGFGGAGLAAYEAARPSYPAEAVEHCVAALGLARPAAAAAAGAGPAARRPRVLDLAAGTGKLTRQLDALGLFDLAVAEPSEGMLGALRAACPGVEAVRAGAAALPFDDGAFDAVFVGQAFHCERSAVVAGWVGPWVAAAARQTAPAPWAARGGRDGGGVCGTAARMRHAPGLRHRAPRRAAPRAPARSPPHAPHSSAPRAQGLPSPPRAAKCGACCGRAAAWPCFGTSRTRRALGWPSSSASSSPTRGPRGRQTMASGARESREGGWGRGRRGATPRRAGRRRRRRASRGEFGRQRARRAAARALPTRFLPPCPHARARAPGLGTHEAALKSAWFAELFDVSPSPAACSALFRWARPITREGAWLRVLSNSFIAALPEAEREGAVRPAVEAWAERHAGRFEAPPGGGEPAADLEMVTETFVCRRRG